jgi:hypothetical protein
MWGSIRGKGTPSGKRKYYNESEKHLVTYKNYREDFRCFCVPEGLTFCLLIADSIHNFRRGLIS